MPILPHLHELHFKKTYIYVWMHGCSSKVIIWKLYRTSESQYNVKFSPYHLQPKTKYVTVPIFKHNPSPKFFFLMLHFRKKRINLCRNWVFWYCRNNTYFQMFAHFDRILELELNDVFISNKNTSSNLGMCMHAKIHIYAFKVNLHIRYSRNLKMLKIFTKHSSLL